MRSNLFIEIYIISLILGNFEKFHDFYEISRIPEAKMPNYGVREKTYYQNPSVKSPNLKRRLNNRLNRHRKGIVSSNRMVKNRIPDYRAISKFLGKQDKSKSLANKFY